MPLAYPEPLRISTADASATVGFDPLRPDHGALSRGGTAMIAGSAQTGGRVRGEQATTVGMSRDVATAARPSTRERAIPFQMQLASLQLRKTAGHVREEQAAITYGEAVNELANLQQERLVEKELQSQALLEADVGVYLSVPDL